MICRHFRSFINRVSRAFSHGRHIMVGCDVSLLIDSDSSHNRVMNFSFINFYLFTRTITCNHPTAECCEWSDEQEVQIQIPSFLLRCRLLQLWVSLFSDSVILFFLLIRLEQLTFLSFSSLFSMWSTHHITVKEKKKHLIKHKISTFFLSSSLRFLLLLFYFFMCFETFNKTFFVYFTLFCAVLSRFRPLPSFAISTPC